MFGLQRETRNKGATFKTGLFAEIRDIWQISCCTGIYYIIRILNFKLQLSSLSNLKKNWYTLLVKTTALNFVHLN